jgi:NAD(P)H-hydrate epimerase
MKINTNKLKPLIEPELLAKSLVRKNESHKGQNGRVLVIGGSEEIHGAPLLAAQAALVAGADLVQVLVPQKQEFVARVFSPDLLVHAYEGNYFNHKAVFKANMLISDVDVVLVGPGIAKDEDSLANLNKFLKSLELPVVVDAAAIQALAGEYIQDRDLAITPHLGELMNFLNLDEIEDFDQISDSPQLSGFVSVIKGAVDLIKTPSATYFNTNGNPGMTVGGSGDVLAGLLAGFRAQGMEMSQAAQLACYVNGCAGDELFLSKAYFFSASDLLQEVPFILAELLNGNKS